MKHADKLLFKINLGMVVLLLFIEGLILIPSAINYYAYLQAHAPQNVSAELIRYLIKMGLMILLIISFTCVLLSIYLNRLVMRPIRRLVEANEAYWKGGVQEIWEIRLEEIPSHEIGEIMRNRAKMLGRFHALRKEIERELEKIRRLSEDKSRVLHAVSHDIRNPLTAIIGYLQLAIDEVREERLKKMIQIVIGEVQRLNRLTSDLLEVEKLGQRNVLWKKESFSLCDLMKEIAQIHGVRAEQKGIRFVEKCSFTPLILADNDQFSRVFTNLISNAIKFTPPGGTIEISAQEAAGGVQCGIANTGSYISAEDQKLLFEKFSQTSVRATGGEGGSGLGLAITKEIINHYGGKIWVDSDQTGTRFHFYVPVDTRTKAA